MNVIDEEDVLFAYVVKRQGLQMIVVVIIIDLIQIKTLVYHINKYFYFSLCLISFYLCIYLCMKRLGFQ